MLFSFVLQGHSSRDLRVLRSKEVRQIRRKLPSPYQKYHHPHDHSLASRYLPLRGQRVDLIEHSKFPLINHDSNSFTANTAPLSARSSAVIAAANKHASLLVGAVNAVTAPFSQNTNHCFISRSPSFSY
jgi:hypothetical protein